MAGADSKIGVKVFPDVTGFDAKVKKVTGKRRETVVAAVLNARHFEAQMTRLRKESGHVEIHTEIADAVKRIDTLKLSMRAVSDKRIQIEADVAKAKANLALLQHQLKDATEDQKITILADIDQAKEALLRFEKRLADNHTLTAELEVDKRKAQRELADLKVHLKPEVDAARARAELAVVARDRWVELKARLNTSTVMVQMKTLIAGLSGLSMLKNWATSLVTMLSNLPQTLLRLSMLIPMLTSVAAVALSAVAALGPLAGSLVEIGPGALIGVAGLGALAASVGVVVAAFKDVDADDAWESAKRFNTVLEDTKERLHEVRLGIQEAFFRENFAPAFQDFTDRMLPQMQAGLEQVAAHMSRLFTSIIGSLATGLGDGKMQAFLDQVSWMFINATTGIQSMITGLTNIGLKGGEVLPLIGTWATDIGERFQSWTETADIAGMLQNAATQAGFLWSAVKDIGGTISGVFQAMSTGSSSGLESFAATMGRIRETVESPAFQTTMGTIFRGAAEGAAALKDALGPIGDAVQRMAPLLGEGFAAMGESAAGILERIADALSSVEGQEGLSSALDAITYVADNIDLSTLGPALEQLGAILSGLAPIVTYLVNEALPLLTPVLEDIKDALPYVQEALETIVPPVVDFFTAARELGDELGLLDSFWNDGLMPTLELLGGALSVVAALLRGDFAGAWDQVSGAMDQEVQPAFMETANVADSMFAQMMSGVLEWAAETKALINAALSTVKTWFSTKFNEIVQVVSQKLLEVVEWMRGLPGRITGALGNLGSLLWNAGDSIIQGFLNGIKSAFEAVKNFVGGIADWIAANKGPLSYDYQLLQPAAKAIMGGFGDELKAQMGNVEKMVTGFAPSLSSAFTVTAEPLTPNTTIGGNVEALLAGILDELRVTPSVTEAQIGRAITRLAWPYLDAQQTNARTATQKNRVVFA